jgi:hypothetical protein
MDYRDKKGQFAVGNGGGPGRPPRQSEKSYLKVLMQCCSLEQWAEIVSCAVEDAKAGDGAARQWLARYLCGIPQMAAPTPFELEIEAAAGLEDDEFEKAVLFRKLR